ncbi:MAG: hypothetical protein IJ141_06755 [Lachnospiraceae bacterium]|nr:hypothetical protein [Lachnospiraceae bacterium]
MFFQFELETNCRWCGKETLKLNMPFEEFVELDLDERKEYIEKEMKIKKFGLEEDKKGNDNNDGEDIDPIEFYI